MRERFASAAEHVRHTPLGGALAAVERAGVRHGVKVSSIARFESYYQKVDARAIRANSRYEGITAQLAKLEASLALTDKSIKNLEDRNFMTSDLKTKMAHERSRALINIESVKSKRDKAEVALKECNDIKRGWETEQKRVANQVLQTVEEKTAPYRERLENLRGRYDALSAAIDGHKKDLDSLRSDIGDLEAAIQGSSTKIERTMLKSAMAGVRSAFKEAQHKADLCLREQAALKRDMAKAQTQVDKWGVVKNEITRVTERERTYVEHTPEPEAAEEGESFKDIVITPAEYIKEWNELFPTMPLTAEIFTFAKDSQFKPDKIYVAPEIEKLMTASVVEYAKNKKDPLSQRELAERFDKLRRALEQKVQKTS